MSRLTAPAVTCHWCSFQTSKPSSRWHQRTMRFKVLAAAIHDRGRMQLHPLAESEPPVDLDGASVVRADGKERTFVALADTLDQRGDQRGGIASMFIVRQGCHSRDLAIAGQMHAQA